MSVEKIRLEISGMTCDHCASTIKKFLGTLPGINAEVSSQKGEALIEISDGTSIEKIITTIESAGFEVKERLE